MGNPALAKYERMKKMGMPTHAIVNKMRLDGISSSDIAEFENPGANKKKKKKVKEKDPRFAKYDKMKKMGMPNHAIVNRMRLDGIEASLIHKFEHQDDDEDEEEEDDDDDDDEDEEDEQEEEVKPIDLNTPKLKKYARMKKMGFPTSVIVNKMKLDGIDANIISAFENPPSAQKKEEEKEGIFWQKEEIYSGKRKDQTNS